MSEWISVKDRLPNGNGKYLVVWSAYPDSFHVGIAYFTKNLKHVPEYMFREDEDYNRPGFYMSDSEGDWETTVSYWMELPDLPKGLKCDG